MQSAPEKYVGANELLVSHAVAGFRFSGHPTTLQTYIRPHVDYTSWFGNTHGKSNFFPLLSFLSEVVVSHVFSTNVHGSESFTASLPGHEILYDLLDSMAGVSVELYGSGLQVHVGGIGLDEDQNLLVLSCDQSKS